MLSDADIIDLAQRMSIPLEAVVFKDQIPGKLKYNKAYIINLEDAHSKDGKRNQGTHWTCFQCNRYKSGKIERIYFDSFGMPPPTSVTDFVGGHIPHNDVDIQSLMNEACGWYCLAFLHFINASEYRSGDLFTDANHFISMFNDLEKSHDFKKNEFILKHFFRSSDPSRRMAIEVQEITRGDKPML